MTSTELTKEYLAELLALADAVNVAIVARLRACSAPFVAGDRSCGQALAAEQVAEEALADAMKPDVVRALVETCKAFEIAMHELDLGALRLPEGRWRDVYIGKSRAALGLPQEPKP